MKYIMFHATLVRINRSFLFLQKLEFLFLIDTYIPLHWSRTSHLAIIT